MIKQKLTQAIKVPEKLSTTFFDLDCVKSAIKYEGKVHYVISGTLIAWVNFCLIIV